MTVRARAKVTVSEAVDGTKKRKQYGRQQQATRVEHRRVDPAVWARAQQILRPGERLLIIDETTVVTVYR